MQNLRLFNYYTSCQSIHTFQFIPIKSTCGGFHTLKPPVRICLAWSQRLLRGFHVMTRTLMGIPSLKLTASLYTPENQCFEVEISNVGIFKVKKKIKF